MPTASGGGEAGWAALAAGPGLSSAGPITMKETARRVSAWAWAEGRLYEVLGAWAADPGCAACKIYFDACSQHHAWRARLWRERLSGPLVPAHGGGGTPSSASGATPGGGGPPSGGAEAAAKALIGLEGDVRRLAAYCRVVLARSLVGYRAWQGACGEASDRPVARALSFATADVMADWQEGEGLLVVLLSEGRRAATQEAAEAVMLVEQPLVAGPRQFC